MSCLNLSLARALQKVAPDFLWTFRVFRCLSYRLSDLLSDVLSDVLSDFLSDFVSDFSSDFSSDFASETWPF